MKIPTLLCATACALLLAGGAAAHETGKPHKHRAQKAQTVKPVTPAGTVSTPAASVTPLLKVALP